MSHSQFSLLQTKRFWPLFVTQFLGALNDNVFKNALVILITYRAGDVLGIDPRLLVTAAAGIFILPFFLFSATAGQMADRFDKSKMIQVIKLAEIILMILAVIGLWLGNYGMLMAVLFGLGAQSAFFGPLKYSILPDHLDDKEIIGGNGLIEAGTFLAILIGTIIGGLFILKTNGIVFISTILLLSAFLGWVSSKSIPSAPALKNNVPVNWNLFHATWKIIHETHQRKDIFLSIIGISWFWLIGFTFLAQFPIYAQDIFNADESVVTLFLTIFSMGIAIGSLLCNKLLNGKISGSLAPVGALGMSLSIIALWFFSTQVTATAEVLDIQGFLSDLKNLPSLISLLGISIFGGIYIVPLYAIMQTRCHADHRSRVIAGNNIINAFFMVMGAIIATIMLKNNVSVTNIFLTVGLINILIALIMRRIVRKVQHTQALGEDK